MFQSDLGEAVEPSGLGEVSRAQVALEEDGPARLAELAEARDPLLKV